MKCIEPAYLNKTTHFDTALTCVKIEHMFKHCVELGV